MEKMLCEEKDGEISLRKYVRELSAYAYVMKLKLKVTAAVTATVTAEQQ